jgi:DNA-binding NarL/FixJ family response regulator
MACELLHAAPKQPGSLQGHDAIRVLVADDHAMVRDGLRHVFRETEIEIIAEAATPESAIKLAQELNCDVVLLDLGWPGGQATAPRGYDILCAIRTLRPDVHVVVHSMHNRECYRSRCRELGASDYIVKGTSNASLVEAIRKTCRGSSVALRQA